MCPSARTRFCHFACLPHSPLTRSQPLSPPISSPSCRMGWAAAPAHRRQAPAGQACACPSSLHIWLGCKAVSGHARPTAARSVWGDMRAQALLGDSAAVLLDCQAGVHCRRCCAHSFIVELRVRCALLAALCSPAATKFTAVTAARWAVACTWQEPRVAFNIVRFPSERHTCKRSTRESTSRPPAPSALAVGCAKSGTHATCFV